MQAQCASLGLDPTRLVPAHAAQGETAFELWGENLPAFEVFQLCVRQWRVVAGMSRLVYLGLEMTAVDVALQRLQVPQDKQRELLHKLTVMEDEGLVVLNRDA